MTSLLLILRNPIYALYRLVLEPIWEFLRGR